MKNEVCSFLQYWRILLQTHVCRAIIYLKISSKEIKNPLFLADNSVIYNEVKLI